MKCKSYQNKKTRIVAGSINIFEQILTSKDSPDMFRLQPV